tara:strand:- start:3505 stop:3750 length:246 start_codon:yes stop_codon:yes gene_type:complete
MLIHVGGAASRVETTQRHRLYLRKIRIVHLPNSEEIQDTSNGTSTEKLIMTTENILYLAMALGLFVGFALTLASVSVYARR